MVFVYSMTRNDNWYEGYMPVELLEVTSSNLLLDFKIVLQISEICDFQQRFSSRRIPLEINILFGI